jgi:CheY-like chemotaxis protein
MDHKVCVVEDDLFTRIDAVTILEEAGFPVEQFSSGDRAASYLEINAPDIAFLFTDVMMPGNLNGVALARLVEERWPWIRVVITSSMAACEIHQLPSNARFIQKPWRPSQLLDQAMAAQGKQ